MKQIRMISFIACIVIVLQFLIIPFFHVAVAGETPEEKKARIIKKCISCCENKYLICINLNPDRRLCAAEKQKCVDTCNSEGVYPSEWRDCWSQAQSE